MYWSLSGFKGDVLLATVLLFFCSTSSCDIIAAVICLVMLESLIEGRNKVTPISPTPPKESSFWNCGALCRYGLGKAPGLRGLFGFATGRIKEGDTLFKFPITRISNLFQVPTNKNGGSQGVCWGGGRKGQKSVLCSQKGLKAKAEAQADIRQLREQSTTGKK